MAENWFIRDEILGIGKFTIEKEFDVNVRILRLKVSKNKAAKNLVQDLSMPIALNGYSTLLQLLADLFNAHFNPAVSVAAMHIAVTSGAAACLDNMLGNICDEGNAVLIPGPYWSI